jgi:outer membrane protein assembly factor BamB
MHQLRPERSTPPRVHPLRNAWLLALDRETGTWSGGASSTRIRRRSCATTPCSSRAAAPFARSMRLRAADRWTARIDSDISAPLVWDSGWLFVVAKPGTVVALRASDGHEIWRRSLGGASERPPAPGGKEGCTSR